MELRVEDDLMHLCELTIALRTTDGYAPQGAVRTLVSFKLGGRRVQREGPCGVMKGEIKGMLIVQAGRAGSLALLRM